MQIKIDNLNSEIDLKNNEITNKTNEITDLTNSFSELQITLENQTKENTLSRLQLETLKEYIDHIIKSISQSTMLVLNDSE